MDRLEPNHLVFALFLDVAREDSADGIPTWSHPLEEPRFAMAR